MTTHKIESKATRGAAFPRYGFNMFMSPDPDPSTGAGAGSTQDQPKGGASENGGANSTPTPPQPERLFTQAELDQQINARLAREKRAAEEASKAAAQEAERKKLAEQGQYKELLDRERADAAAKVAQAEARAAEAAAKAASLEIERRLERACAKAVRPDQVAALVRSNVQLDATTGEPVVLNAAGVAILDPKTGRPFTLERYAETWLEANPHFLPASTKAGAGSSQAQASPGLPVGGVAFDKSKAHDIEHVKAAEADLERQRIEKLRAGERG